MTRHAKNSSFQREVGYVLLVWLSCRHVKNLKYTKQRPGHNSSPFLHTTEKLVTFTPGRSRVDKICYRFSREGKLFIIYHNPKRPQSLYFTKNMSEITLVLIVLLRQKYDYFPAGRGVVGGLCSKKSNFRCYFNSKIPTNFYYRTSFHISFLQSCSPDLYLASDQPLTT